MAGADPRGPPKVKCPCSSVIGHWEPGESGRRKKQDHGPETHFMASILPRAAGESPARPLYCVQM